MRRNASTYALRLQQAIASSVMFPSYGVNPASVPAQRRWFGPLGGHGHSEGFKSLGQGFAKKVQKDISSAASTVQAVAHSATHKCSGGAQSNGSHQPHTTSATGAASMHQEHCLLGWTPEQIYLVVADVAAYPTFLPWCVSSSIDSCDAPFPKSTRATATLGVGFSFLREKYQSEVLFRSAVEPFQVPGAPAAAAGGAEGKGKEGHGHGLGLGLGLGRHIKARLHGESTILKELHCDWYFDDVSPVLLAQKGISIPQAALVPSTDVRFEVHFTFRNPLHQSLSSLVMSNVVTVMTASFEKRCGQLYGPPAHQRTLLPPVVTPAPASQSTSTTTATVNGHTAKSKVDIPLTHDAKMDEAPAVPFVTPATLR